MYSSPQIGLMYIIFTLVMALMLNLAPWAGVAAMVRPDFVALLLLYWSITHPNKIGIGTAWIMGLLLDVAEGSLLGQHALTYAVTIFFALALRRRILMFPQWQQALHIVFLLLLAQGTLVLIKLFAGGAFTGLLYFAASLTGALLWPLLPLILRYRRKSTMTEIP